MKYLRTLTEKSVLGFGKYAEMKVGEVLKVQAGPSYLIWVYFNCSMVSFCDDLLKYLKIDEDARIEKPGIDEEKYYQFIKEFTDIGKRGLISDKIISDIRRKRLRAKGKARRVRDSIRFSKKSMQRYNQGHR